MSDSNQGQPRPPLVETIERMVQSATFGAQMLESTRPQTSPPPAPAPAVPESRSPVEPEVPEEPKEAELSDSKPTKITVSVYVSNSGIRCTYDLCKSRQGG